MLHDPTPLEAFSSNELAFLSMLFFGVGLYGNLQFLGQGASGPAEFLPPTRFTCEM